MFDCGINFIGFNFDGASSETYQYIKGNSHFDRVKNNVVRLFELRNRMAPNCAISVNFVSARHFAESIEGKRIYEDDSAAIRNFIEPMLRKHDRIKQVPVSLERFAPFLNQSFKGPCPNEHKIYSYMMISPSGKAYVCCSDFWFTTSLGDLYKHSIKEIWEGPIRKAFLKAIYEMRYEGAFPVCQTCSVGSGPMGKDVYLRMQKRIRTLFVEGKLAYWNTNLTIIDEELAVKATEFAACHDNYLPPIEGGYGGDCTKRNAT